MKCQLLTLVAYLGTLLFGAFALHAESQDKDVPVNERPLGKSVRCVTFSPDGALLAATLGEPNQKGRVVLWDAVTHKQLWSQLYDNGVPTVVFAPDGKSMVVGGYDNKAKRLDTQTGQTIKIFEGHTNFVRAAAFTSDGKTLATGSWDQSVKLWDLGNGTVQRTLNGPANIFSLHFSPKDRWLLAANGSLHVWDVATAMEKNPFAAGRGLSGWAVFFDDNRVVVACHDGTMRMGDIAAGEERVLFQRSASRLAVSSKAALVAIGGNRNTIELLDLPIREPNAKEKERIAALLVLLDDDDYATREAASKEMVSIGMVTEPELRRAMKDSPSVEVRIRCRRLIEEIQKLPGVILAGHTGNVESLAFSPDGRLLASGSMDGTVRLWDVKERKEIVQLTPVMP